MPEYEVLCIRRDGTDVDRRIDGIGGYSGGQNWYLPIDDAIEWIRTSRARFFVDVAGRKVYVIIRQHPTSRIFYLTTEGDGFPPNNLLNLPECP